MSKLYGLRSSPSLSEISSHDGPKEGQVRAKRVQSRNGCDPERLCELKIVNTCHNVNLVRVYAESVKSQSGPIAD